MPHTSTPSSTPTSGHPPQSPIALPAGCRKVRVELGERGYDVCIGAGLLDLIGGLTKSNLKRMGAAGTAKAFIAADEHLPIAAIDHAAASLYAAGFTVTATRVRASEQHKSLAALDRLLTEIAVTRHERWDPIIALGGGIVGDLTGLAAAMYRRGVPVIQCPTTLLSMVDASVGGKTGVNLDIAPPHPMAPAPQAFSGTYAGHSPTHAKPSNHVMPSTPHHAGSLKKNLLGIFHQPSLVIADVTVLASLPDRIFRSGLAECVKHGMIGAQAGDPGLFDWTTSNAKKILARDVATLTELVARNVAVKASIVAGDEREEASDTSGPAPRALLNLGHTFGHAIETIHHLSPTGSPSDAPLSHGEAISLGLVAATAASIHAGLTNAQHAAKLAELLTVFSLPTKVKDLPSNHDLHALMLHDKKTSGGRLRLVLPTGNATATLVNDPAMAAVDAGWAALRHPIG